MGPFLCVITILVMMSSALSAQENSAEIPTQAPRPQPRVPPLPAQAGESREGAPDSGNPRFAFHRSGGGFVRLDLVTGSNSLVQPECGRLELRSRPRRARRPRPRDCAAATGQRRIEERIAGTRRSSAGRLYPAGGGSGGAPAQAETIPRPPQTVPPAVSAPPRRPNRGNRIKHRATMRRCPVAAAQSRGRGRRARRGRERSSNRPHSGCTRLLLQ